MREALGIIGHVVRGAGRVFNVSRQLAFYWKRRVLMRNQMRNQHGGRRYQRYNDLVLRERLVALARANPFLSVHRITGNR